MRTALWLIPALLMAALMTVAASADAGELRATIRNVKPQQGKVWVALYDGADPYKADRRFAGQIVDASGPELTVVFAGLPSGRYGLSAFQDVNGDGTLGTNMLGVPTEPYGFSRAAQAGAFGPPGFDALAVAVDKAGIVTTVIEMTE